MIDLRSPCWASLLYALEATLTISTLTADRAARVEHYRHKQDRLRQVPRKSDKTLRGEDLEFFRLAATGFGAPLPPPSAGVCWEWRGQFSDTGKPVMRVQGKRVGAHLAAYATWIRPVKPRDVIRQACGNRKCVNPCHLATRPYGDPSEFDDYDRPKPFVRANDHHLAQDPMPLGSQ